MHSAYDKDHKIVEKMGHGKKEVQSDIMSLSSMSNPMIKNELIHITENIKKEFENGKKQSEIPKQDKVLDFLSSAGKVSFF